MLRATGDLRRDLDLVQLLREHDRSLADVLLAVGTALGDHRLDLRVLAGMQRLEREVLELPLQLVDAEPVRERRVDLERLAGLLDLLLAPEVLERAHVVQAVGELDEDDPHVMGHRDDHLPVVLGLRVLAALELDPRQLGDAFDEVRDLVAELGAHLVDAHVRVLDDVVQEGRRDRLVVEPQIGADLGRAERVVDERLARAALLAIVRARRELEGVSDQLAVGVRVVGRDLGDQLFEEILVSFLSFEKSHGQIVVRLAFVTVSAGNAGGAGFIARTEKSCRSCSDDTSYDAARSPSLDC